MAKKKLAQTAPVFERRTKTYYYVCIRDGVRYGDQTARCGPGGVEDSTMIKTYEPVPEDWLLGKPKPGRHPSRNPPGWREATIEEIRQLGATARTFA